MRRIIILSVLLIFLISLASAEVVVLSQPKEIYNLGDTISVPIKITASEPINNRPFTMTLSCNGIPSQFYFEYITLSREGEKSISPSGPLTKELIGGRTTGTCVVKSLLGSEQPVLTDEFKISDLIHISLDFNQTEISPQEYAVIEGQATKENGETVQGFVKITITAEDGSSFELSDTVTNGYFDVNLSFPKETKAGSQLLTIEVYEIDIDGKITNKGSVNYNLYVKQVPTSLEIFFEEWEVQPGTNLQVKTILHDQTGEPIETTSIITIKNDKNEILEQKEISTGSFLEYPISYDVPPATWNIYAVSNKLTSEANFSIGKKESIDFILINGTITIINTGNVEYCNKSVLVKIGNESLNIDVCLDVGKSQDYLLTAPDGEYQVKVIKDGKEEISENVMLTGKAVDAKEISSRRGFFGHPLMWIFVVAICGFVAFVFLKRGYRRTPRYSSAKKKDNPVMLNLESPVVKKGVLVDSKNKAEVSLSMKGDKQDVSMVCLKIKNFGEVEAHKGEVKGTLQKIVDFAEDRKAVIYENQENIFIILAPAKTKTFSNERTAMIIGLRAKEILREHNKMFKQKINFGISVTSGTIIGKQEGSIFKFMTMGTLMGISKKTAAASNEDVLLNEKMRGKLGAEVKVDKQYQGDTPLYAVKEVKDREEHKTFLSAFVKRLEKEKEEQNRRNQNQGNNSK